MQGAFDVLTTDEDVQVPSRATIAVVGDGEAPADQCRDTGYLEGPQRAAVGVDREELERPLLGVVGRAGI
jgi:hypothetical protein